MGRATVGLLLVIAAFAPSIATAVPEATIRGTVTDVLGVAVVGARVTDGSATAFTGTGGTYSLRVDPALVNTISASMSGYVTVSKTVVPLAEPTVDFSLPFRITPSMTPTVFSAAPQTLSLEARSLMPRTGNCVVATDGRTGTGVTMEWISTDASGVSRWVGAVIVPAAAEPGFYRITIEGHDCSTLRPLTDTPEAAYLYDRSAPVIGVITPAEGRLTIAVIPLLPTRDGSTRVFGPVLVQVDAEDDVGLGIGRIDIAPAVLPFGGCSQDARSATSYRYVCGPFLFIRPGLVHTLTVRVSDVAGKAATVTMPIREAVAP